MQLVYLPVVALLLGGIPSLDAAEETKWNCCRKEVAALMKTLTDCLKGMLTDPKNSMLVIKSTEENNLSPCESIRIKNIDKIALAAADPCSRPKKPGDTDCFEQSMCFSFTDLTIECVHSNEVAFVNGFGECLGVNMADQMCGVAGCKESPLCTGVGKAINQGAGAITSVSKKIPVLGTKTTDGKDKEVFMKLKSSTLTLCINMTNDWNTGISNIDSCSCTPDNIIDMSLTFGGTGILMGTLGKVLTEDAQLGKVLGLIANLCAQACIKPVMKGNKDMAQNLQTVNCGD